MSRPLSPPHSELNRLTHIVALGGGHGLGRVMSALNFLGSRLTGIVTTTDNGGSTGRIRSQQGGIAWGDLRNCLNQIITQPSTASALFEYRFEGEGELAGHNLGNLMLKALENMQIRPTDAVNLIRELLKVESFIIPMSEKPVHLAAYLASGKSLVGEVSIDELTEVPQMMFVLPLVPATPEAIKAIQKADLILIGPGSFLTSILPPFLLPEISRAIADSSALKIFIDNLGVEQGPAAQLSLKDRINYLHHHIGSKVIDAVITESQFDLEDSLIFTKKLKADDVSYRHDRQLLCAAIDDVLKTLSRPDFLEIL
ncbi:gluconeogenesis factor YvcK family protein [Actinobacillus delphinicola]|uniref:Putative gluconeogenesis factor n=1 Tax=Actinobacillus delphinicola TaxID=51161 RepID=A0A448TVC7_9PAST|nr:uridine diphosphate-N-acetylglucosamine-binding protein YvcK [Actinobacillus delphinicola]VEJ09885.1 Uncharacterised protein family UPF0052 [Actinobacillus delphinicola]